MRACICMLGTGVARHPAPSPPPLPRNSRVHFSASVRMVSPDVSCFSGSLFDPATQSLRFSNGLIGSLEKFYFAPTWCSKHKEKKQLWTRRNVNKVVSDKREKENDWVKYWRTEFFMPSNFGWYDLWNWFLLFFLFNIVSKHHAITSELWIYFAAQTCGKRDVKGAYSVFYDHLDING